MNKTVTVNIGGIVFHIDENAYERFKQYLESIRMHFSGSDGRDEIMQDIEARIAEMFQDRIREQKQVITLADVEEVTAIMGKPEQFGDEEKKESEPAESAHGIKRRLFRNPDDKILGGVCSGISAYFDIDPVWIRLILAFTFFFYGSGFLLYLILWIVIPKAVTTADKLQMKGEPVTIGNIEKNIQEEMDQVKRNFDKSKIKSGVTGIISRIFDALGQLLRMFIKVIGKIIAALFIFIGLVVGFAVFASFLAVFKVPGTQYPEVLNQIFPNGFQFNFALIAALLVVGIPFFMLAYVGARVLFNIRKSTRIFNLSVLGLWLSAIVVCAIFGVSIARDFSEKQSILKEIPLLQPSAGKMVLKMDKAEPDKKHYFNWDDDEWNGDLRLSLNKDQLQSRDIRLDIVASPNDSFGLRQICYARGSSKKAAADHASNISYSFSQVDSVIQFTPFFVIDKGEKYRAQKIQLVLLVPVGKEIYLDQTMSRLIFDIENTENILDRDMTGRTWRMTREGLQCIDCSGEEAVIGGNEINVGGGHGGRVHINDNGVYIKGDDGEILSIDSNGVFIRKNGKTRVIKKGNVKINIDQDGAW